MKSTQKNFPGMLVSVFVLAVFFLLPSTTDASTAGDTLVYVTNSGKKYHRENCSALKRSKIEITLLDAVKSDYRPCSTCKPSALNAGELPAAGQGALYRVNIAAPGSFAAADPAQMLSAEVIAHVDGDTVRVRIPNPPAGLGAVETIRLIGVDTPETVHPKRKLEFFGKEASSFTKNELLGRQVSLAFDWDLRDKYGRLLAYIYTSNGGCFNAALIREGYGHAYTRFTFQFMDEFRALEQDARRHKRGLWAE
ncbi:MAG: thermonuclease family protein [Treponema sp.]|jgi:micrococcal nuclease|nr:thermonuclease family protein [Treponema sp.]